MRSNRDHLKNHLIYPGSPMYDEMCRRRLREIRRRAKRRERRKEVISCICVVLMELAFMGYILYRL